jgi:thiamine pyrophosphokinase
MAPTEPSPDRLEPGGHALAEVTSPPPAIRPVPRHALVVAAGDVPARAELDAAWPGWADAFDLLIAADGGLDHARGLGLAVDVLVGDLDSLGPGLVRAAAADGVAIRRARPDKDESDTELALLAAAELGATQVVVLGALGGERPDHALANVWLLAHPALADCEVVLLDRRARVSLITAPAPDGRPVTRTLDGPVGSIVSLLPFGGDAVGVTTRGLRYPLAGETLATGPARGLSNERAAPRASVTVERGRLLVVESASGASALSSRS